LLVVKGRFLKEIVVKLNNLYRPHHPKIVPNVVRKPNPKDFLKKKDFSHSLKGIISGLVTILSY
jgi:hypothetical protein